MSEKDVHIPEQYKEHLQTASELIIALGEQVLPIMEELDGDEFHLTGERVSVTIERRRNAKSR